MESYNSSTAFKIDEKFLGNYQICFQRKVFLGLTNAIQFIQIQKLMLKQSY